METNPQESSVAVTPVAIVRNSTKIAAITLCALGVLLSFFLPWITLLGANISGYQFQGLFGGRALLLWSIPIFSIITIFATATNRNPRNAAQLAGALPFAVLGYGLYNVGQDIFQALGFGAYLGLVAGLALIILPRDIK